MPRRTSATPEPELESTPAPEPERQTAPSITWKEIALHTDADLDNGWNIMNPATGGKGWNPAFAGAWHAAFAARERRRALTSD